MTDLLFSKPRADLIATCNCICPEIRQELNTKFVEFVLSHKELLQDGKITIISIGSGALGQELSCSKALAEKGIGVNWILVDACYTTPRKELGAFPNVTYTPISKENAPALFKEFDAQKPAGCKVIARFSSIHHYVLYMKSLYNNQKLSMKDIKSYMQAINSYRDVNKWLQMWELALDCYKVPTFSEGVLDFTQEKCGKQGFPAFIMAFDVNEDRSEIMLKDLSLLSRELSIPEPAYLHCERTFVHSSSNFGINAIICDGKLQQAGGISKVTPPPKV